MQKPKLLLGEKSYLWGFFAGLREAIYNALLSLWGLFTGLREAVDDALLQLSDELFGPGFDDRSCGAGGRGGGGSGGGGARRRRLFGLGLPPPRLFTAELESAQTRGCGCCGGWLHARHSSLFPSEDITCKIAL